jgi:hypothetical protein
MLIDRDGDGHRIQRYVRWQADHLMRDMRRLATEAGFDIVEANRVGAAGLVHRVDPRRPADARP